MPRLSAVDQAFYLLETRDRPMSIGALFLLVPPPSARGATGAMEISEDGDPAAGTEQLFKGDGAQKKWVWNKSLTVS